MRPVRRLYDRTRFSRWKGALPYSGNWFILDREESKQDLVDAEERNRDRVRLLLDRYGILFRELLQRESHEFQWSAIFRSLRLMELSGEVLSGYFFEGIPGPQFLAHRAMHMLRKDLPYDAVYWINAADPASCCGIPVEGLKERLPRRLDSHHLVYRGKELVLISERRGKTLTFFIPPDDPEMPGVLGIFHHLLSRSFMPLRRITIETINGEDGATSPYLENFREAFDLSREHKIFHLHRKL